MVFYLGCAVWAYDPWQGSFYDPPVPANQTLLAYAQRLTAIEGNTTFYGIPRANTIAKWCRDTPETFRFCCKFPKTVSHQGLLVPQLDTAKTFLERLHPLGERLRPTFLQLPPRYSPSLFEDLQRFLVNFFRWDFPWPSKSDTLIGGNPQFNLACGNG